MYQQWGMRFQVAYVPGKAGIILFLSKKDTFEGLRLKTYFAANFLVAWNLLKFGMPTLFVLKNVPVFFQEGRKICIILHEKPTLLLFPHPNNVGFQSLRAKTLCMCVLCYWRGGGGGGGDGGGRWSLKNTFEACFPLVKKKTQEIF